MNKIILCGYVGKDPEIKYVNTQSGQMAVCRLSLAVNRKYKKSEERAADWFGCTAFGTTAENINKYFKKGSRILISGRVQTGTYEDNEGVTRARFDVIIEDFDFIDKKGEGGNGDNAAANVSARGDDRAPARGNDRAPQNGKQKGKARQANDKYYEMPPLDEEDLPF